MTCEEFTGVTFNDLDPSGTQISRSSEFPVVDSTEIMLNIQHKGHILWIRRLQTWWSGSGGIQTWFRRPAGFLQCFATVGLVIWPVKIVPEITCNVLRGTLSLYATLLHARMCVYACMMYVDSWNFRQNCQRSHRNFPTLSTQVIWAAEASTSGQVKVDLLFSVSCGRCLCVASSQL